MKKIEVLGKNAVLWYLIFLLSLCLFTVFSLLRIKQPVAADELNWLVAAKTFYISGVPQQFNAPANILTCSPYLYLYSLTTVFELFGASDIVARIPGVISGILAIILVFIITKLISQGTQIVRLKWAALSSLLYALTPALIQGSVIVDIDNTVLVPTILFLCWTFVKYKQENRAIWAVLMSFAMGIALWGRVTTPMVVAFLFIVYDLHRNSVLKSKLKSISAITTGVFLFVISWYLYCNLTDTPFVGPFIYTWHAFKDKSPAISLSAVSLLAQNVLFFILWIGVMPLLLFLIVTWRRYINFMKQPILSLEDVFLAGAIVLFAGYTLIGGTPFGFPKYHSPAIPLMCIFVGVTLSKSEEFSRSLNPAKIMFIILSAFAVQTLIVGDFIYILRYTLRESIAFASSSYYQILKNIVFKTFLFCAIYAVLFATSLKLRFSKNIAGLLILLSIGSSTGTSFIQSVVSYDTGYNYGAKGTIETSDFVRREVPLNGIVVAPSEVIYYLNLPNSGYIPNALWTDVKEIKKRLTNKNTAAFIYSVATNTVHQLKTIRAAKDIQETLQLNYSHIKIGSYDVWIHKPLGER